MITLICTKTDGDTRAQVGQKYTAIIDEKLKSIVRYRIPDLKYSAVERNGVLWATLEYACFEIVN